MEYQSVSLQQMKDALATVAGSKFPVKLAMRSGAAVVQYIRGFADSRNNVVLVSETSYSLALKIVEVKDIVTLEYATDGNGGTLRAFQAKWLSKSQKDIGY